MAKKNLNEDALKTNLDAEVADELVATITPTYKQALDDHKRNKKSKEDAEKERAEATEKAVEVKDNKKVNDGAKKLHLSEDLGDDDIDENTFSAFVHNELFGEHNYKPFLKLPGQAYYYDIEIGGDEVGRADREKVGGSPEDFVVGIRLSGKTPEERKEETRRMRALAKKLDLPFGITKDKKFAFVLIFDYIARRDANRVMRELDFENVPDKPFIRSDRRVEESKQLNEGPGAGYTITGWLDNCKVNSVVKFKDDPENNKNEFYTGYIVDVDATCELSDLEASSYYHGNGIADNGHVPAKITQIAISAGGLESENPTNDEIAEYVKEELSVLSSDFKSSLGGGWAHTTFEGEFLADLKSDNTYISQVVVVIENKNVIRAIDNAVTGEDWVEEYAVLDEDGDEMEFFEDEESAIDFAKKNRGATVEKRELQYTLLGDLESEDIFYENAPVTVWEREYSKSYRYDESCKTHKAKKGIKKALKEGEELKEGLNGDGIDVKFDLVERAESYIDYGHDVEDAVARAIDDGLIYDEDRIAIAYYVGALDTSDVLDNAYDDIYSEIYEAVKDYHHDENDDDDDVEPEVDESLKENKDLEESITIEVDDDDALDMLMDRVDFWAKGDEVALDLYQQMYENWIAERFFDGGKFDVKEIVDNDWVNYCKIVEEGDEHYDEILSTLSNGETEFGNNRIEAQSRDDDGKEVFLIRYIG